MSSALNLRSGRSRRGPKPTAQPQAKKANPSRGGDAKPEGSHGREMAQLPAERTTWRSIVAIGMNLRNILSGAVLALAMALALVVVSDGAQAKQNNAAGNGGVQVCNVNGNGHKGGNLTALDAGTNATGLKAMP